MNLKPVETTGILCEPYPKDTAIARHLAIFAKADVWDNIIVIKPDDFYFGFASDFSIEKVEKKRESRLEADNILFGCCTIFECPTVLQRCE